MISVSRKLCFLMCSILLLSCGSTDELADSGQASQATNITEAERPLPYPIDIPNEYLSAVERGTRTDTGAPGENFWQQYATYDISAKLNPDTKLLEGELTAVYQNNSPHDLSTLHMELALNVHKEGVVRSREQEITGGKQIKMVRVNGERLSEGHNRIPAYYVEGTQLVIIPREDVRSGAEATVEVSWQATLPLQGASGRNGWDDDLFFVGYWYPQFSVYDDVYGWFTEPFRGNAEFYHGFADYSLSVTMPDDWVVMGTGEFMNPEETLAAHVYDRYRAAQESDEVIHIITGDDFGRNATSQSSDGYLSWNFESEQVRDVAFSATRKSFWDAKRTPVGDLDANGQTDYSLMNAFYRELAPLWSEVADYNAHAISFLSELTGYPYPWPHMTSVEGSNIIGGGMEYPMMTIMGDYNERGAQALYSVTAHELAHMWFPMIVSTNERIYTWIDEGNTVFATDEARHNRFPEVDKHAGTQFGYLSFAIRGTEGELMRWSDFHYSTLAYRTASYPKPASILVALRGVLGDDLFWQAYRTMVQEWAFKQMYPWDMFRTFERVSGQDLEWFWRAWYYETWTLNQELTGVTIKENSSIIQVTDRGDVPMPVLLAITRSGGEVIQERISEQHWLQGRRTAELELPYTDIIRLEIDPEYHFPDVNRKNMLWESTEQ